MKTKQCNHCKLSASTLYRIQTSTGKVWIFVCTTCLTPAQKLAQYKYGGTWQGARKKSAH